MELAGMSEGMRALFDGHKKLHESVLKLQTQIEEEETAYLEETPHGNIIRGWDGFIDAKPPRKDTTTKKVKPYSDAEHLFSSCCLYATLASEPTADLIDPTITEEPSTSSRRKLSSSTSSAATSSSNATTTTSSSSGKAGGGASSSSSSAGATSGTPVASKLQRGSSFSERRSSISSASASGKDAANSNSNGNNASSSGSGSTSATGKASKLKKRKREKLESQESVEILDDAGGASANVTKSGATLAGKEKDFLDVF